MNRFPAIAFGALVLATVAAFFITQHLKTTTPLLASPRISPAAIDPAGAPCRSGQHRISHFSFYALHGADVADVRIRDAAGNLVQTIATRRRLRLGVRVPDGEFAWAGRDGAGRRVPDGRYTIEVHLERQDRTLTISSPAGPRYITVITRRPTATVTGVSSAAVARGGAPVRVALRQTGATAPEPDGGPGRGSSFIDIFSFDAAGRPHLAERFRVSRLATATSWNLRVHGRPAPPGRYLIGMDAVDPACNRARFPLRLPRRLPVGFLPPRELARALVIIRP